MDTDQDDFDMDLEVGDVGWLTLADPYILLYLDRCRNLSDEPIKQTPKCISLNTPLEQRHAGSRCRVLAEHGLLNKHDRGVYSISDLGQRAARGQISAADLRSLSDGETDEE